MTVLSRLLLNPRHPQAQVDLASSYDLHRTLSHAFADSESDAHRARHGVLFRVEPATHAGVPVLVQSTTEPDWSRLPAGYALRVDGPKSVDLRLAEGQRLRFRLVANPVRRTHADRADGTSRVHRQPLVHPLPTGTVPDGYLLWLQRQAESHGFRLPADGQEGGPPLVEHVPFRVAPRRRNGEAIPKDRLSHFGVRFDGVLTVTDPDALTAAVRSGIGPAKAFGFGLISLGPA